MGLFPGDRPACRSVGTLLFPLSYDRGPSLLEGVREAAAPSPCHPFFFFSFLLTTVAQVSLWVSVGTEVETFTTFAGPAEAISHIGDDAFAYFPL